MAGKNAIYEKSQGTTLAVSATPVSQLPAPAQTVWVDGSCATKEISFQSGQKADIDVTTLCSVVQEQTNGLEAPGELTLTRNWARSDPMLAELETASANDEIRAYRIIFPSGNGFQLLAEVRQNTWSVATSNTVAASYTLRVSGKPVPITGTPTT